MKKVLVQESTTMWAGKKWTNKRWRDILNGITMRNNLFDVCGGDG